MIPSSYREGWSCNTCTHRAKVLGIMVCLHDRSEPIQPVTDQWFDDHAVAPDGCCDEWRPR